MPPKQIPASVEVVDLDSSDDDGVAATTANRKPAYSDKLQAKPPSKGAAQLASVVNNQSIEDRSFWRAGAYEIGTTKSSLLQGVFQF